MSCLKTNTSLQKLPTKSNNQLQFNVWSVIEWQDEKMRDTKHKIKNNVNRWQNSLPQMRSR